MNVLIVCRTKCPKQSKQGIRRVFILFQDSLGSSTRLVSPIADSMTRAVDGKGRGTCHNQWSTQVIEMIDSFPNW